MEIILGKFAGFCPGVKRAWKLVEKAVKENQSPIYILGELIHNRQAIEKVESWGVRTIENLDDLESHRGILLIRAHGEPPTTYRKLAKTKLKVVDATCLSVSRVQQLAQEMESKGYQVFVCGEKDHPEALATIGYTQNGKIISSLEEAKKVPRAERIGVLAQTTFSPLLFKKICQILKKKAKEFKSLGTICNFVQLAQREAKEIAQKVDLVIVVGGRQSSNTKRLTEAAEKFKSTYHIETVLELKKEWFRGAKKVGLLAGASTPDWIIKKVKKRLEEF